MSGLQPVRGTHDLLPEDMRHHRAVGERARDVAARYGYQLMATPIFEFSEVFRRTLGETSDVVMKEMYSFALRDDGAEITLRPENTASVARAVMSNGLTQQLPLKFFYDGPMFRHERPQKGRQRQFHQIGVELFGVPEPLGDVEIIAVGAHILEELGVLARTRLELNTLGDTESRQAYRAALVDYFTGHKERLSRDSQERLDRNPLRILDSKNEGDREVVADAPKFTDYLNQASQDFFGQVKDGLEALGIAYEYSPRLVRGLDYYCHTAFEFKTDDLGAQDTVMGGGRYDYLMETMGGPAMAGVGWAAGIERLALLLEDASAPARPILVVPVGDAQERAALTLTQELRKAGWTVELGYGGGLKKRMKRANRINARLALLLGEDELARRAATLRDLDSGHQEEVPLDGLAERLAAVT
ncbi:MAG: histidine--tRNA ligase [Pseudomonadota bacterium]